MSHTERVNFFRPWNRITMNSEVLKELDEVSFPSFSTATTTIISVTQHNKKIKNEQEDDDCESIISSSCSTRNYNLDDSPNRRSCSVISDDVNSKSLDMLNKFVLDTHQNYNLNERKQSKNSITNDRSDTNDASVIKWNNFMPLNFFYPSTVYEYSRYQTQLPLQDMCKNNMTDLSKEHLWPPANYQCVQHAINKLNHQDIIAKHIQKIRPKKFKCPYCNIAFSNNGQLKGHLRIHTGERPFKCDFDSCSKSFTRNEELTRHKRIHTGLRPYPCPICYKGFGRKDHLKKHIKIHDNRNVYHITVNTAAGFHFANHSLISATGIPYNVFALMNGK